MIFGIERQDALIGRFEDGAEQLQQVLGMFFGIQTLGGLLGSIGQESTQGLFKQWRVCRAPRRT